jgi:hypothetical protein
LQIGQTESFAFFPISILGGGRLFFDKIFVEKFEDFENVKSADDLISGTMFTRFC